MGRQEEYKLQNEQFLEQLRTAEGIKELQMCIRDSYHTIAFLVPHSELLPEKPGKDEFMVYAVSIKN